LLVVCGFNQQTPLALREKIAINAATSAVFLAEIAHEPGMVECALLSTCHRTEIYAIVNDPQPIINWWQAKYAAIWSDLKQYFYVHLNNDALIHSLRVACGLNSMLIGEPQILGQMKQAYQQALDLKLVKNRLVQWFEFVFNFTKKIRTQSGISALPISVASVAVDSIQKHIDNSSDKTVLIIGSGDTARLAAIHLQEKAYKNFMVTSRQIEHAQSLALKLDGKAFPVTELEDFMPQADILVTATSCPLPFITKQTLQKILQKRNYKPMILVDLAVPRDIEPEVENLEAVTLINIDNLMQIKENNQLQRKQAGKLAEQMIQDALRTYTKKNKSLQVQNLICDYRASMHELARQEVVRARQKLSRGHCQYQVIEELADRLIQKIMHQPTKGLREAAIDDRQDILELAQYLFTSTPKEIV